MGVDLVADFDRESEEVERSGLEARLDIFPA
jgi:hypothetical protein